MAAKRTICAGRTLGLLDLDSVQLVHITPVSIWFMVLIISFNYSMPGGKGIVSLLICLPVVGCLTGKYTLKDVVFEAVICFDCRNERKEEGGFLLNR